MIPVHMLIKLLGSAQGLMKKFQTMEKPVTVKSAIYSPQENGTEYYIYTTKVVFKTKEGAEDYEQLQKKVDDIAEDLLE